jgi:hypothetical protein
MNIELRLAKLEPDSTGVTYQPARPRMRNLGSAIFWAAIVDYRSLNQEAHADAEQFLYPLTAEWQSHYDWVVTLAEGLNRAWLREALDRSRNKWDRQRALRKGGVYEECS